MSSKRHKEAATTKDGRTREKVRIVNSDRIALLPEAPASHPSVSMPFGHRQPALVGQMPPNFVLALALLRMSQFLTKSVL